MTSMQQWTTGQWTVFALTIAAGLIAAALAYAARSAVLGWTAPAPLRRVTGVAAAPRPSLVLTSQRAARTAAWTYDAAGELHVEHDPMTIDYAAPGVGALSSVQAMVVDPTLRTSAEIEAEESAWINAYADLTPLMPETDAERERMRVALEPALRTARLWLVRAGEVGARAALSTWRMDTPTGEYPAYDVQARLVRALLAS